MAATRDQPLIPEKPEDMTPSWLSAVLGTKISSEDFHLETNIQSGSGYLSNMVRLKCKSECGTQNYNLIVKLLPPEGLMRSLVLSEKFDEIEINFYRIVLPDLLEIVPELSQYLCKSYYGYVQKENAAKDIPYASVLVLEDLKPQGYYTINFAGEESKEQMDEVIKFMAKFHFAGSTIEEKKNSKLPQLYPFLHGLSAGDSAFYEMSKAGFANLDKLLIEYNASPDIIEAYRSLSRYPDVIIQKVEEASKEFAGMNHGDLWSNNLLFNDDPNYDTKVIDWQLLGYRDPNCDLATTIISSLPPHRLTKEIVQEYLELYYSTFVEQCEKTGNLHLIRRNKEDFSKFFYSWGMAFAILWHLMAMEPFAENFPRLVNIYRFLAKDMKAAEFLLSVVS